MKKFLSFAFALLLSIGVSAQTTLTEAVNFKSTAHGGEKVDLFEILDGGQYALINFFVSSDPDCKEVAPRVVDAYYKLGCNEGDVYFMEVSPTDHNAAYSATGWISTYNIPYPTIHTKTGGVTGDSISAWYGVTDVPTFILIAPDRKIVMTNCTPSSADDLVEKVIAASDNKISESYCGKQIPEVAIEKVRKDNFYITDGLGVTYEASTKVFVNFRANAAVKSFYYIISDDAQLTSEDIIEKGTQTEEAEFTHTFDSLKESTTYYVYAQAVGYNDTVECAKTAIEVKTLCPGDEGKSEIEVEVMITDTHVRAVARPNESTADYHFGYVKKEYYETDDINKYKFLINLINDDYPLCERNEYLVHVDSIPVNTPYYVVGIGRNGEGEWGEPTVSEEFVVTKEAGPAEVALDVKAMPTEVTVTGTPNIHTVEFHFGVVTKAAFDANPLENLIQEIRYDGHPAYEQTSATWVDGIVPGAEYVALGSAKNANNEWGETAVVPFTTPLEEALVEMEANFNIYPNPAQSMINIESSLNGEAQINIFDMTTRCVKQVSVSDMSNVSINVEDLNKGVYFISIQQNNSYSIQKLVIE